ncbi:hypothetical protein CYMTET_26687 [Cymbomonas tetramitiformis]|uniref:Uncharacterized protein n=1 Tax=Cymbomonas tetramitiformis TaxID=36881 RepID=A0AAE0FRA7_9CHLO|nr:hypothetical protein CYMTET_26687 [Cymbomonas tetramitiformis]
MDTRQRTAKRKLLREFDLDSSIRLVDAVRDSPTVRTPPVPASPAPAQGDTPAIVLARQRYEGAKSAVNAIYSKGRHRKWAKAVKQHALAGDYFSAKDDVSKLAKIVVDLKAEIVTAGLEPGVFDLDNPTVLDGGATCRERTLVYDTLTYIVEPDSVAYGYLLGTDAVSDRDGRRALVDFIKGCVPHAVRQKLQAEHSALVYPGKVDPRPILAEEQQLVRENRATDWTPTVLRLGGAAGTAASAAVPPRNEILIKLFAKIDRIENFIKTQRTGGAAAILPKRTRKGLAGFRAGSHPDPHVGFDGKQRTKALPKCPRCPTAGDGHTYHSWFDCPLGGKRDEAGSMAAYCYAASGRLYAGRAAHSGDVASIPDRRRQRGSGVRGGVRAKRCAHGGGCGRGIRWRGRLGVRIRRERLEDLDGDDMDMAGGRAAATKTRGFRGCAWALGGVLRWGGAVDSEGRPPTIEMGSYSMGLPPQQAEPVVAPRSATVMGCGGAAMAMGARPAHACGAP